MNKINTCIRELWLETIGRPDDECCLSNKIDKLLHPLDDRLTTQANDFFATRERLDKLGPWPLQFDKHKLVPAAEKYRKDVESKLPLCLEGLKRAKMMRAMKAYGFKPKNELTYEQLLHDVKVLDHFTNVLEIDNHWFKGLLTRIETAIETGERMGWLCTWIYTFLLRLF